MKMCIILFNNTMFKVIHWTLFDFHSIARWILYFIFYIFEPHSKSPFLEIDLFLHEFSMKKLFSIWKINKVLRGYIFEEWIPFDLGLTKNTNLKCFHSFNSYMPKQQFHGHYPFGVECFSSKLIYFENKSIRFIGSRLNYFVPN